MERAGGNRRHPDKKVSLALRLEMIDNAKEIFVTLSWLLLKITLKECDLFYFLCGNFSFSF